MSIRCITFDLDDTLWEVGPVIARAECVFYTWMQQQCPRITQTFSPEALVAHRHAYFAEFPQQRHDLTALRTRWLEVICAEFGYSRAQAHEGFRVFWEHRNAVTLFDEVESVLQSLKERYRMGVITNGNACVEHIGIDHYFDFVVSSERAGVAKPNADIFHLAMSHAGDAAHEIVHVGDDPKNDVLGASAVGMRAVWYNPRCKPWPGGQTPDAVITTLSELGDALARW